MIHLKAAQQKLSLHIVNQEKTEHLPVSVWLLLPCADHDYNMGNKLVGMDYLKNINITAYHESSLKVCVSPFTASFG